MTVVVFVLTLHMQKRLSFVVFLILLLFFPFRPFHCSDVMFVFSLLLLFLHSAITFNFLQFSLKLIFCFVSFHLLAGFFLTITLPIFQSSSVCLFSSFDSHILFYFSSILFSIEFRAFPILYTSVRACIG